jgi:membrane protein required for colicin V production
MGFLFGVLRGIAVIAITFFAYKSILNSNSFALVDESRSAVIFGNVVTNIEERNPERLLGWITTKYEELVAVCEVK